ncbi:hypothetical protein DIPPA_30839 [Diplonema papillatum]|nr:hypothetical protein DIPPA_30839 [Diplonema papillatum]
MHDLSFHTREPWLSDGISADRYQGAASMVGQNVCVVDDPQYITAASQTCFDKNVESSLAPLYCGRVGRVIEVNVAACTARVAFGDGHSSWLPLLALTLCNPDPFLSMGSRNTSMSVFGRPDTAAAAKEIAAYENARREERRAARYR